MNDVFAQVAELPGVGEAVAEARSAVDRLLGHRILRRRSAEVSAEAALRGARASAALEGADLPLAEIRAGGTTDPVVQGALRVSAELGTLEETWRQAPRQALARLHVLAAADALPAADLGRPRTSSGDSPSAAAQPSGPASVGVPLADVRIAERGGSRSTPVAASHSSRAIADAALGEAPAPAEVAARLDGLSGLLTAPSKAPALVVGAIVHGELLALRPFGWGDGIVARAAQRLTLVQRGLDPKSLTAPEIGHAELAADYAAALKGYVAGTPEGVAGWVRHCADAVVVAARDSLAVCEALLRG